MQYLFEIFKLQLNRMSVTGSELKELIVSQGSRLDVLDARLETVLGMLGDMMTDRRNSQNNSSIQSFEASSTVKSDLDTAQINEIDELLDSFINEQTMGEYCAIHCPVIHQIR
jgi:hypothetical protein